MRTRLLTVAIAAITLTVNGQTYDQANDQPQPKYGIRINNFNTGSGFKMGTEATGYVQLNKQLLEVGMFYDYESSKVSGITVHHEVTIININLKKHNFFEGYIFYNFIFRKTTLNSSYFTDPFFKTKYNNAPVMSMEHYLGLGGKIQITSNIYLNAAYGYGLFLGSVKKADQPTLKSPVFKGKNGWGNILKFGIGYNF
jgi:hypothetical protein